MLITLLLILNAAVVLLLFGYGISYISDPKSENADYTYYKMKHEYADSRLGFLEKKSKT